MGYDELLATLPRSVWDGDECLTCLNEGLCRERSESLTDDVVYCLSEQFGVEANEATVLQWLLDEDEIGVMRDEDVEELAKRYLEEVSNETVSQE